MTVQTIPGDQQLARQGGAAGMLGTQSFSDCERIGKEPKGEGLPSYPLPSATGFFN